MSVEPDLERARELLIQYASSKRTRTTTFSRERPVEWRPHTVLHPEHGMYFTDSGAWDFIVELLEQGHLLSRVTLSKPPGAVGYVLLVQLPLGTGIYIKLELCNNGVHGRSFHNSER